MTVIPSFAGALLVLLAGAIWGKQRSEREIKKLRLTKGLLYFVSYVQDEIKSFKTPLLRIYEDFTYDDPSFSSFVLTLRDKGAAEAFEAVKGELTESVCSIFSVFVRELGGTDSEGQDKLCTLTKERLEREVQASERSLPEKLHMYRIIPVLIAVSVIILLI